MINLEHQLGFNMNPYSASESSLRSETEFSSKALRAGRLYFWIGSAGVPIFSVVAAYAVVNCLANRDRSIPNPLAFAIVAGSVFGFFTMLSVYQLRFYFKYRLHVDDLSVMQVGVFTTKSLRVADIQSMVWRNRPAGVIIKSDSQKLGIEFGAIDGAALNELVAKIRRLVPSDKQVGWDKFKHKHNPVVINQKATYCLLTGFAIFGILLGLRPELPNAFLRVTVVGVALVIGGIAVYCLRAKR